MGLLLIERVIIESLIVHEKNLGELVKDTGMKEAHILNTLFILRQKNFIKYKDKKYSLNKNELMLFFNKYKHSNEFKYEVSEIFSSFISQHFSENKRNEKELNIRKIWLTAKDEKILNSYFINLESFIKDLEKNQRHDRGRLCEKRLIFWGNSNYSDILKASIESVQ